MSDYKNTLHKVRFSEQDKESIYRHVLEQENKGFNWGMIFKPIVVVMAILTLFFGSRFIFSFLQRSTPLPSGTSTPATAESSFETEESFYADGYPWNEEVVVETLPVYKNESLMTESGYQGGISNPDMVQMVKKLAAEFGVPIEHPFEAANADGSIAFRDANELKTDYTTITYSGESLVFQVTRSGVRTIYVLHDNGALAQDIVQKLLQPMSASEYSLGFIDPVVLKQEESGSEEAQTAAETAEVISPLLAFERGDTFPARLFNYDADRLEMIQAEGVIAIQRYTPHTATERLLRSYPVITLQEAKLQLMQGHYLAAQYSPVPKLEEVSAVELRYDLDRESNYFIPYYIFTVRFAKAGGSDQLYYAVQAVEESFQQDHPDYVRAQHAVLPGR